ncbi:hypothetical protein DVH24_031601 [Malus domestica]|uniref:Uncharacterized protein n=1 Tax=Malus domestica TaxID=3750 RepID=A0A498J4S4_MALDO|nr:hypothetical protein DVH24_031601 [Malus domestica]
MNQYGHSTRLKVSELHEPALSRHLNQQSWCQQYKQKHCYENRAPIRHLLPSKSFWYLTKKPLLPCGRVLPAGHIRIYNRNTGKDQSASTEVT